MRPRLLYSYLAPTSFVRDDLALLRERYDVSAFEFGTGGATSLARGLWRQRRWLDAEAPRADAVVGWFADYHMVLPLERARRRGIPLAVMLGGFDAACLPQLKYGVFCSRWRGPLARRVLRGASLLLPVAGALVQSRNAFGGAPEATDQGVVAHVEGLSTPAAVVPTGYDPEAWQPGQASRSQSVCAVALISDWRTFQIKGADLLLDAARQLPEVAFEFVGVSPEFRQRLEQKEVLPPNMSLHPPVAREALAEVYRRTFRDRAGVALGRSPERVV